jgi:hypothetical protein
MTASTRRAATGKVKTNRDQLVKISALGEVTTAWFLPHTNWFISNEGVPRVVPNCGGVTYNVRVGHPLRDIVGDHVEPAVSMRNPNDEQNAALNLLACVGNKATVVGGDAKGATGTVTGKHGGIEHVMVDFTPEILEKLVPGDKIVVQTYGQGMLLPDFPEIACMSVDPDFFGHWVTETRDGKLVVPVTHHVPAGIMGSGLGANSAHRGDYDITLFDEAMVARYKLDTLRMGDIVAVVDADATFGRYYLEGAVSIGIICHGDSTLSGHGPGVTGLLASRAGAIEPAIDSGANIGAILGLI